MAAELCEGPWQADPAGAAAHMAQEIFRPDRAEILFAVYSILLIACIRKPRLPGTTGKSRDEEPIEVMDNEISTQPHGMEDVEIQEWLESLDSVLNQRA